MARDMALEMQRSGNLAGAGMWPRVIVARQELRKPPSDSDQAAMRIA